MSLLVLAEAQLAFGHLPLLDRTSFALETGERLGLIGRNGTGKSSLLKILAGLAHLDDGSLQIQQGLRIRYVAQEPELSPECSVFEAVSQGLTDIRALRHQYESLTLDPSAHQALDAIQSQLDTLGGWSWEQRVQETLDRLGLDGPAPVSSLSGGQRKRVSLAQALVTQPDVLLLDEPTNHLDLEMRDSLLLALQEFPGAVVVVSHDRALLGSVCDEFVLVSAGRVAPFDGDLADYAAWLAERQQAVAPMGGTPAGAAVGAATGEAVGAGRPSGAAERKDRKRQEADARNVLAPLRAELRAVEAELETLSAERRRLEQRLADPAFYASADPGIKTLPATHAALLVKLAAAEDRWLELSERLTN